MTYLILISFPVNSGCLGCGNGLQLKAYLFKSEGYLFKSEGLNVVRSKRVKIPEMECKVSSV